MFSNCHKTLNFLTTLVFILLLSACQQKTRGPHELIVGVIAGPEAALAEEAKVIAKERGLNVTIVEFEDYAMPNRALAEGAIDLNVFQHGPYLEATNTTQGYQLVSIGKTFIYPLGFYSQKYHALSELPPHSKIGLANDPSNQARALLLLAHLQYITLASAKTPSISDITANPHQFTFVELDAAQLPRALPDVDMAAINTNYAIVAHLNPSKALALESKDSPYANLIVARSSEKDLPKYQLFVETMHDPRIKAKAHTLFHDYAIPAW